MKLARMPLTLALLSIAVVPASLAAQGDTSKAKAAKSPTAAA